MAPMSVAPREEEAPEPVPSTSRASDDVESGRKRLRVIETMTSSDQEEKRSRLAATSSTVEEEPTETSVAPVAAEDFELVIVEPETSESVEVENQTLPPPVGDQPEDSDAVIPPTQMVVDAVQVIIFKCPSNYLKYVEIEMATKNGFAWFNSRKWSLH